MADKVAKVYGSAVFDSVKKSGYLKEMYSQMGELKEIFDANPEYMKLLTHPNLPVPDKQEMVERAFKGKLIGELYGLLMLLIEKDRVGALTGIMDELTILYKEEMGIGVVYVKTASPLREDQKAALEKKLLADTKYTSLEMNYEQDESLIAGMVIRIGDRVVDSSVATRLEKMTRQLKTIQIL